jgi:hypothetical protein
MVHDKMYYTSKCYVSGIYLSSNILKQNNFPENKSVYVLKWLSSFRPEPGHRFNFRNTAFFSNIECSMKSSNSERISIIVLHRARFKGGVGRGAPRGGL